MANHKERPHKFSRIFGLGEERVLKINNMLDTGCGPFKVARILQNDWGVFQDIAEKTLINQLARYKADRENRTLLEKKSKKEIRAILSGGMPEEAGLYSLPSLVVPPNKRVAVLEKYEEIREIQLARIKEFTQKEQKMPMPISSINKEIELYVGLLDRIQKTQFDLGVDQYMGPVSQTASLTKTQTVQNPDGSTLTQTTVEAVTTALAALTRLNGDDMLTDAIAFAEQEARQ